MGERGPIPKKNEAKMGHRTKAELAGAEVVNLDEIPDEILEQAMQGMIPADEDWHPIALHLYQALAESGQRIYYQPSDWAVAYLLCESLSRDLYPQFVGMQTDSEGATTPIREEIPLKGASMSAYLKAFNALMLTEGDRRRLSLELERESLKGKGAQDPTEDGVVLNRAAMFSRGGPHG